MRTTLRGAVLALVVLAFEAVGGWAQPNREADPVERLERGSFLVAGRELRDANFRETVVLVVELGRHEGAIGLVINRPSTVDLSRVFTGIQEPGDEADPLFVGGPVEPLQLTALVRSPQPIERADLVFDDVFFSGDVDVLEGLARSGNRPFRIYAGYAGWAPGQLEGEIALGGWHVVDGRAATVFERPADKIWSRLILMGTAEWARRRTLPGRAPDPLDAR